MEKESVIIVEIKKEDEESSNDAEEIVNNKNIIVFEKYLFFIGFVCPIAWFLGSSSCRGRRDRDRSHFYHPAIFLWKKRCRIAATLSLTLLIVIAAIVMVVNPKLFGLKTESYATGAQTSSATNNAIRPGVPIIGTNDWGDTVAGISVDNNF
ncbi:MAG: hypothetical protein EXX96DRAFT_581995 [Benjaminiella poitrasii]|nr:MAG: hypothetical protein EXX96DRAFT_581995 [Benjaminiella poitrasii]